MYFQGLTSIKRLHLVHARKKHLSLPSHGVLCLCQTEILRRRIQSYMSLSQDQLKFYRLVNFDGGLDFVANALF